LDGKNQGRGGERAGQRQQESRLRLRVVHRFICCPDLCHWLAELIPEAALCRLAAIFV
jgi:hypothetical protein